MMGDTWTDEEVIEEVLKYFQTYLHQHMLSQN